MKFPIFVDIKNKNILVVGAGRIGCRRIRTLLMFGADITVVADRTEDRQLIKNTDFIQRTFEKSDIDGRYLVIAASDERKVNHEVAMLCKERSIPVSVADSAEESTFYFPAVCADDKLCIGIVSDGNHHKAVSEAAKRIRSEIM